MGASRPTLKSYPYINLSRLTVPAGGRRSQRVMCRDPKHGYARYVSSITRNKRRFASE